MKALFDRKNKVDVVIEPVVKVLKLNPQSKEVLAYVGKKLVGKYDSLTKCAGALGLSRPAVKKAIENGVVLDNGFKLKFNN
jgi:hypothetical protein